MKDETLLAQLGRRSHEHHGAVNPPVYRASTILFRGMAAREEAVHALAAKAELYARATGYRVVRLVSLSEGGGVESYRPPTPLMAAQARVQNVPVTIAPGELTVRVQVSGVYELAR